MLAVHGAEFSMAFISFIAASVCMPIKPTKPPRLTLADSAKKLMDYWVYEGIDRALTHAAILPFSMT